MVTSSEGVVPRTLKRSSLVHQVRRTLKAEILTGALVPDQVYTVVEFAEQWGVSRTPVREAILELKAQGLVEILPNVGFRVVSLSKKERQDILEIREMLEVPALASIAGKLSEAALEEAETLCQQTIEAAEAEDLAEFLSLDRKFHVFLVAQTGNERLARLIDELRQTQRMPALRRLKEAGNLKERGYDHRRILDAILRGDPETTAQLVRDHLDLTRKELELE